MASNPYEPPGTEKGRHSAGMAEKPSAPVWRVLKVLLWIAVAIWCSIGLIGVLTFD
jgi:hypothetical protein